MRRSSSGVTILTVLVSGLISCPAVADDSTPEYNRDVRPILAEMCFPCHGPDSAARKADLRVDQRAFAIEAGAIVPGQPDRSELVRRILSDDLGERMPPASTQKQLSPRQSKVLRDWVASGAEYQAHWSLIAPERPVPPRGGNESWVRNPVDRFVLAGLEARGLSPAPEADRRTLARRLSLDLTGLLPDPAEVDAFVADPSDRAYEKLVDRWMDTPQWGEHRGRYWLDLARYADTHGIHFDNYREIWAYRDWVIQAFNRDLPFDEFTVEQLAGDLLPSPSLDQRVATGFNRCNITTNEGGIIDEEYKVLYARDRTETLGQVWLGMSVGCAVCHDHKFDPLMQREFYELSAFFNNTTQAVRDGNVEDTPPVIRVPRAEDRERAEALLAEIPAVREQLEMRRELARPQFTAWLHSAAPGEVSSRVPTSDLHLRASLSEGEGQSTEVVVEGQARRLTVAGSASWQEGPSGGRALQTQGAVAELPDVGDFDKQQAFTCAAWVMFPANDSSGAICARMDEPNGYRGWDLWVQGRRVGSHVIHRWPDNAIKVVGKEQVPANRWVHVATTYDGSMQASGLKVYYDGVPQATNVEADQLRDTTRTEVPLKIGQRHNSASSGAAIQDLRIYRRALSPGEVHSLARTSQLESILAQPAELRTEAEKEQLYGWWVGSLDAPYRSVSKQLAALEQEQSDIQARGTIAHVMQERAEPATAFILSRGEYDKRLEEVTPATPAFLPAWPGDLPRDRLGLAQWLLIAEQPLTARVTVNRFWEQLFGAGLVATVGDFGVAGQLPSHPQLLDWLAVEFRESGWRVKRFFKLLVTSATYRQSAVVTPAKLEADPDNRLLSRGARFRMDAEMVRDLALDASGLLVPQIGGPSVKPYQPEGVWEAVAMIGSNTRDYRQDSGEALYRRSMYTFWKRSAPPASMEIFNAPSREFCTVRRERTNTPLQALVTLNDPQFVEACRVLAERAYLAGPVDGERADFLMRALLCRSLKDRERPIVESSLQGLVAYYDAHPGDAEKLLAVGESPRNRALPVSTIAAWTMLTNQLMNLDEVLNK